MIPTRATRQRKGMASGQNLLMVTFSRPVQGGWCPVRRSLCVGVRLFCVNIIDTVSFLEIRSKTFGPRHGAKRIAVAVPSRRNAGLPLWIRPNDGRGNDRRLAANPRISREIPGPSPGAAGRTDAGQVRALAAIL